MHVSLDDGEHDMAMSMGCSTSLWTCISTTSGCSLLVWHHASSNLKVGGEVPWSVCRVLVVLDVILELSLDEPTQAKLCRVENPQVCLIGWLSLLRNCAIVCSSDSLDISMNRCDFHLLVVLFDDLCSLLEDATNLALMTCFMSSQVAMGESPCSCWSSCICSHRMSA